MPPEFVDGIWSDWKPQTRDAVLRLYRSADPEQLALAGRRLGELSCPALVVWGQQDPYIAPRFGGSYVAALPGAKLVPVDDAGHWPWIDRPELPSAITGFLDGA